MRSSNKPSEQKVGKIVSILKNGLTWISDLLMFKIEYKQLMAMWTICALMLSVFTAPLNFAATMPGSPNDPAQEDYSQFEPLNGDQSFLSIAATEANLAIERLFTPSLKTKNFNPEFSSDEKTEPSDDKTKKSLTEKSKNETDKVEKTSEQKTGSVDEEKAAPEEDENKSIEQSSSKEAKITEENNVGKNEKTTESLNSSSATTIAAAVMIQPADRPVVDGGDVPILVSSTNNLGNPMGQTEPSSLIGASTTSIRERAGIGNFNFDVPAASVPGRGSDVTIGLTYNSQVWSKVGTEYVFNVDGNWMAPGFQIGYGYLDAYRDGIQAPETFVMTDSDGTRRQLDYISGSSGFGNEYLFESSDGSFVNLKFTHCGSACTAPYQATLYNLRVTYSDGSIVYFSPPNPQNRYFPTKIIDPQGNFITIEYLANDEVGKISKIVDTLEREIVFHYSSSDQKLIAISIPGFGVAAQTQVIRFYYEDLTLQTTNRFDGTITAPASVPILKYIYMPGTNRGYRYDYSSYYGMIYKITKLEGMQVTTMNSTQMGSVIENSYTEAAWTRYNYPGTDVQPPAPTLSDVPKYNKRTDDWIGRTGTTAPEIIYSLSEDTTTRTTQITSPDNVTSVTVSHKKPGLWDDGLIKETYITSTGRTIPWSKTIYTWQEGQITRGRKNSRVEKLENINEAGQAKAQTFEYDLYNNQTKIKEHEYAPSGQVGTELRRTETTYQTGGQYNGWVYRNIVHLPTSVKTIVNNTIVSRTDYEYDSFSLLGYGAGAVVHHDERYNPDTPDSQYCHMECPSECQDPVFIQNCTCDRVEVCDPVPIYDYYSQFRGNLTKVTEFADATNNADPNKSVNTTKYDITGNVVEASLSCCSVKTLEYSPTYHYAYPTKETKGSGTQLISNVQYDLHTGLVTKTINENNQETDFEYETDSFRQKKVIFPNGSYMLTEYSDKLASGSVPGFVRTTAMVDTNKTVQSYSYFNGRGLGIRSATETIDGWHISVVTFDSLGRPVKSYNPFYATTPNDNTIPAGTAYTEVTGYDGLGRAPSLKLQDNTIISTEFNTATTTPANFNKTFSTVTDQAGKKKRQLMDALGRIVRVDEPNAAGSLGAVDVSNPQLQTAYEYDGNDNLTKVTQSDGTTVQERVFKYDSQSRLTHERQVEANKTLDINGVKGAIDPNKWTKVLKYNFDDLVTDTYDARGINTHYTYDGLNRVSQVTYSDGTPTVTYTYDQARTGFFNKGMLTRVETAQGDSTLRPDTPATATEFDYSNMSRAVRQRQSVGAQVYSLEYEYNLAGQQISEKYPSGRIVSIGYDAKGRPANITDTNRTYLNGLQFQGKGNNLSSMTYGNGTTQTFTLNDRLQTIKQELKRGSEVLQKYDYGYGQIDTSTGTIAANSNNGQLAKVESTVGTNKQFEQRFGYDSIGRLSESREQRGDNGNLAYKQNFDYDRFGNMYRKNASNPTSGQQTPVGFTPIEDSDISKSTNRFTTGTTYDDAGNVVQDTKFRNQNFSYDANGRMYKTQRTSSANQSNSVYDSSGMRVATQVDGVWTFSIYNINGNKIGEYGGLPSSDEGGVKYVLADHQGSNRAVINNAGFVSARMDYTAFGEDVGSGIGQRTATQGFGAANTPDQKYALTERDKATDMDHTWFRKNENKAGRWTSPDPYNGSMNIGDPQSFNRYSYVNNQPTNFVDPSGLMMSSSGMCFTIWRDWYLDGVFHHTEYVGQFCIGGGGGGGGWNGGGWNGGGGGGGGGNPAPLTKKQNEKLDRRIEKIKKQLNKEKCKKFLEARLGKDGVSNLLTQLADQSKRFSGPASTNITVAEAGIGGDASVQNWTVSKWIKTAFGGRVNAVVGSGGRVFYRNFNSVTTIIHENLHVSTGLGDVALANKLGVTHDGTNDGASQAVSKALRDNGCT